MFNLLLAVTLAWNPLAPTTPPVQGYRLYYGPNPGAQTVFKDVGNVTAGQITGLPTGVPIYIVCRAYNSTGESGPSNEVVFTQPAPTPTPTPTPIPSPSPSPTPAPTPTPPPSQFAIGNRIQTIGPTNVRASASLSGTLLGQQPTGAQGTLIAGPVSASGWVWWQVNYDSGADGWSGEDNFIKLPPPTPTPTPVPTPTPPPPTPTPTPTPPPTPTPTPTPAPASRYLLSVAGGTGDGFFSPGTSRTINATNPTSQYLFTGWTGPDAALLSNPAADTTTLIVPARNVTVTATYRRR
jgi:hypothetical protein